MLLLSKLNVYVPGYRLTLTIPNNLLKFYLAAGLYHTSQSYSVTENGCLVRSQFLCLPISDFHAIPYFEIDITELFGYLIPNDISYGLNIL